MIDYEKCVKEREKLREEFKIAKGKAKNKIAKRLKFLDRCILECDVYERMNNV